MNEALYGEMGRKVTLKQFLLRQGGVADPKKWTVKTYCPQCGVVVHAYGKPNSLGFHEAGAEIAGGRERRKPGFHHSMPSPGCPLYFPNDPRFAELSKHSFDVRRRDTILEVLHAPKIQQMNRNVLRALMEAIENRSQNQSNLLRMEKSALKILSTLEMLKDHPWLFPYIAARMDGHKIYHSNKGKKFPAAFDAVGEQKLYYSGFEGEERVGIVPEKLVICFVNKGRNGYVKLDPMKYLKSYFLSEQAAMVLAKRPPRMGQQPLDL